MRVADLLSDHEAQLLRFNQWEGSGFSACTYMPAFCTAGKLNEAFHLASSFGEQARFQTLRKRCALESQLQNAVGADIEMREAVVEFWELSRWVFSELLGPRHDGGLHRLFRSLRDQLTHGRLLDVIKADKLPRLSAAMVELAKVLIPIELEEEEEEGAASGLGSGALASGALGSGAPGSGGGGVWQTPQGSVTPPPTPPPRSVKLPSTFRVDRVVDAVRSALGACSTAL